MSSWISEDAHSQVTPFSLVYDALYALLVVLGLHQLSCITKHNWCSKNLLLYSLCCHIGAIGFALAGQIPCIKTFSLTPGFWGRLPLEGKVIIAGLAIVIIGLVCIQLKRAVQEKNCKTQFAPWLMLTVIWLSLWSLIHRENIEYSVHVHHALFAGLFACWFRDFSSNLDIIANAVFIGIVIEGIDFYGIGELTLFMIHTYTTPAVWSIWISMLGSMAGLLIVIYMRNIRMSITDAHSTPIPTQKNLHYVPKSNNFMTGATSPSKRQTSIH